VEDSGHLVKVGGVAGVTTVVVWAAQKEAITKPVKHPNKRVRRMTVVQQSQQAERPEKQAQSLQDLELALGPVACDQCSARAKVVVNLPSGMLTFCQHHYNINAQALTEKGGIAKLLDIEAEKLGSV
jgi:hypothetical protein